MTTNLIHLDGRPSKAGGSRKLKTMLLFPPEWVPTAPYLALPCLTAVLRQYGYPVVQKDVNIEMYDLFFSDTFLVWARTRMAMQLRALEARERTEGLSEAETDHKTLLEEKLTVDVFELAERAESAKRTVRGEDFYDADKLERALNTFRMAMQYISAAYYPASIVFYPMESNLGYRPGVSREVFACLEDEQVNVYRDVCRQLVLPAVGREAPDVVGVSIGTQMQLMAGLTFCRMIKEAFPQTHVTVGGNVITRLHEDFPKQERFFAEVFDSAILYEGEHALVWLLEALGGERSFSAVPNLIWRDEGGIHVNREIHTEKTTALPLPDFDGMPLDSYFVPVRILPYLATRGCYWGRCTFCDHGQGYFDQYRGMPAHLVVEQVKALKEKYRAEHFLFADESYPPALFKKVVQLLVDQDVGIKWTTLIRFEESLHEQDMQLAARSGCCTLYYGMESANERVLELMDKHVKKSVIERNLHEAAKAGIWNHVMAFYGFPGETREEAEETRQFILDNRDNIHSVELFYFVAYRHTPMVRHPEKFGITIHEQEDYDLPLDFYYTLTEPNGIGCLEAMQLCEEFYQNDFEPWAVRVNAREHVFLYISKFGTNRLPQIYVKRKDGEPVRSPDSVTGLVTWPVARGDAESAKEGEPSMARVVSHGVS